MALEMHLGLDDVDFVASVVELGSGLLGSAAVLPLVQAVGLSSSVCVSAAVHTRRDEGLGQCVPTSTGACKEMVHIRWGLGCIHLGPQGGCPAMLTTAGCIVAVLRHCQFGLGLL